MKVVAQGEGSELAVLLASIAAAWLFFGGLAFWWRGAHFIASGLWAVLVGGLVWLRPRHGVAITRETLEAAIFNVAQKIERGRP